ncbi:hypothetical protein QOT17_011559 [Balamuthia mandrillaris]
MWSETTAREDGERKRTLSRLLALNRESYHIEYHGYLSNHMSHGLVALYKLGAPKARLEEFFEMYAQKLDPSIPSTSFVHQNNWRDCVGHKKYYTDFIEFFYDQIKQKGSNAVINEYVPFLLKGLIGSAFHGLIQLGYALEAADDIDDEDANDHNIAEGIAYIAYCFKSCGQVQLNAQTGQSSSRRSNPFMLLTELQSDPMFDDLFSKEEASLGFQSRVRRITQESYQQYLRKYDLELPAALTDESETAEEELLQLFSTTVLKVFASEGCQQFFLLHLVTAMRALKRVVQQLKQHQDKLLAFLYFWRACVCAYIAVDRPTVADVSDTGAEYVGQLDAEEDEEEQWAELIQKVIQSDDEHLIKLVFVCKTESEETGSHEVLYRHTALVAHKRFEARGGWEF